MKLENFFDPKSVAVVGACSDKSKVGYALISNVLSGAKSGRKIFPVTLSEKEVLGMPAYTSLKEIPDAVDLAVIAVRSDIVPQILLECAEKKIPSAIIISAGFKEIGEKGKELEERVASIARENGIALLGPNCLGTIDSQSEFNSSFAAQKPLAGSIAFLSQSGALGTAVMDLANGEGVGFSKFISLGNEAALSEIEFLEHLGNDKNTSAILMYLEKLSNGPEFMRLASEITKKKPIVVLKAGRSARGVAAVASHTGSLAPEDAVFTAACKQAGVIVVESIREFFNMAKLFQNGITSPLRNLVILTNGGGPGVVAADLVDLSRSLSLVELSEETKDALRKVLPPMAAVGNPVDIIGDALSNRYSDALKILCNLKDADGIILMLTPQMMTEVEATAKLILEFGKEKPIIPVMTGGPTVREGLSFLRQNSVANFLYPKDAIEALDNLAAGTSPRTAPVEHENFLLKIFSVRRRRASQVSTGAARVEVPNMLNFTETTALLSEYKIDLQGKLAATKADLPRALAAAGAGPYAMKIISPDVIHKSDSGAVKLNIQNPIDAEAAWDEMIAKNPSAKIEGVLVQQMTKGKEVIIGMKRDPIFGPTILFGLGGIFTEALKDTSLRIAPVSKDEALEMIQEIKGYKILSGLRGEQPVDTEFLADLITKISKLAIDHPQIKEIDFNPVMVTPFGVTVVDVRMMK